MTPRSGPPHLHHGYAAGLRMEPPPTPGVVRHRILDPVPFPAGQAELDAEGLRRVQDLAAVLSWFVASGEIEIAGHAFEEGDPQTCAALAARRAEVVQRELVRLGVPAWSLRARGRGTDRTAGSTDAGRGVALWLCQPEQDAPAPPCDDPGGEGCCRHC